MRRCAAIAKQFVKSLVINKQPFGAVLFLITEVIMLEGILYTIWILVVLFFVLSFFLTKLDEETEVEPNVFHWRRK